MEYIKLSNERYRKILLNSNVTCRVSAYYDKICERDMSDQSVYFSTAPRYFMACISSLMIIGYPMQIT